LPTTLGIPDAPSVVEFISVILLYIYFE